MTAIPFTKMQGLGNDFIVVNNMELNLDPALFPAIAKRICTPRLSLGGDALMVIETDEKIPPVARALIGELENIKSMTYYEKEDT